MRRAIAATLVALSLAGCGGASGPGTPSGQLPPGPAVATAQVRAGFGGLTDTIEIRAVELLPLREAVLVAPDGTTVPANSITVADNPRVMTGQWSQANRWDAPVDPANTLAALTLTGVQAGAALGADQQLLAMVSRADIPLPDPVAYRRDWRDWRIRLTFGTPPGDVVTNEIPAPQPPPG
jgi:hypothetical protein